MIDLAQLSAALAGLVGLVKIAMSSATPLILAATGGLLSERSGVVNIALEGKMLLGALLAVLGAFWTGNPWAGCLLGAAGGAALGAVHFVNCQILDAEHVVSGAALNIVALGATGWLAYAVFASKSSPQVVTLPAMDAGILEALPIIGPLLDGLLSGMTPLFFVSVLAVAVIGWTLKRTPLGLRIRAVGQSPAVAAARGVNVDAVRLLCLLAGGALAGLAGAQLAIGEIGFFTEKMSAGRGFIALAAVIFGRWRPWPVLAACCFFGLADAAAIRLKLLWQAVPDELALALPFALTMLVLVLMRAGSGMPAALGRRRAQTELDTL